MLLNLNGNRIIFFNNKCESCRIALGGFCLDLYDVNNLVKIRNLS